MEYDYLNILKKYNINYLYHFTNIYNLSSILKHGIMNRWCMDLNNIKYSCTDSKRYDMQLNCISLSLSCTNKLMFYYKQKTISSEWVVFELDAKKIISDFYNKIFYCKYNASSNSVINLLKNNKDYLKTINAFNNIFDNLGKPNDQAELLLQGNIDIQYINKIYVDNLQIKLMVEQMLIMYNIDFIDVIIKKEMF